MFREILMDLNDAEGDRAAGVWTLPVLLVGMPVAVLLAAAGKLVRLAVGAWRSGFDTEVVGGAVDECLKPIGWGIILLAAMG
eukprot:gene9118-9287_t